ncbi:MAG: glycosyltransferase family 9 protein [Pigmentiphaga sp.]
MMRDIVVLVRSRPFFGAQLVMFPALHQLKQWLPDHCLRVVARDPLGSVFEALPWVDEFRLARSAFDEWRAIGSACAVLLALHPSSERHGALAALRLPPVRLGYHNGRLTDRVWTHAIAADTHTYRALHGLQLLNAWRPLDPFASARDSVLALAAVLPPAERVAPGGIVLMPGGGAGEFKKWGLDNFLALVEALRRGPSGAAPVHIVLGPAEAAEAAALEADAIHDCTVWLQPSLSQLAALVADARLVVANDCGPSHLGQCSGTPFVGLFDAIKPEWFWPRPLARCLTPSDNLPLRELPLPTVLAACEDLLTEASRGLNAVAPSLYWPHIANGPRRPATDSPPTLDLSALADPPNPADVGQ